MLSKNREASEEAGSLRGAMQFASGVIGVASVVIGIILLATRAAQDIFTVSLSIYVIVAGAVALVMAFIGQDRSAIVRVGYGAAGIACIVAGIVALANFQDAKTMFTMVLAITLGVIWIGDGLLSIWAYFKQDASGWILVYAILSIAAGILLVITPMWTMRAMVVFLGIMLIVLGGIRIFRSFGRG